MKKIIKPLIIIIVIIILLIPIKKQNGNTITYNAISYKYIIWNEESLYNNNASNEIHIFPLNFKNIKEYREKSIPLSYAKYNDTKVELLKGTALWNGVSYDAIYPIAREYKETLKVKKDAIIDLDIGTLTVTDIKIYDVETTYQVKNTTTIKDNKIYLNDLENKEYIVSIDTSNKNGRVSYSFKISVE